MNLNNCSTKTFVFKNYDNNNIKHLTLIKDITNDELTNKFFNDWSGLLFSKEKEEYGYIVEKDNMPIGLITITELYDKTIVFSHIISPNFRGNRYSSKIKKELYNYLFENNLVDKIICYIDKNNKNSISSMMRSNPTSISSAPNNMYMVTYENKNLSMKKSK